MAFVAEQDDSLTFPVNVYVESKNGEQCFNDVLVRLKHGVRVGGECTVVDTPRGLSACVLIDMMSARVPRNMDHVNIIESLL